MSSYLEIALRVASQQARVRGAKPGSPTEPAGNNLPEGRFGTGNNPLNPLEPCTGK